jgi:zinc/manganese transport system permease protein
VLLVGVVLYRPLRHVAFDHATAVDSLPYVKIVDVVFLVLMATTVAVSAQVVGSLLIFILMTLPASAAMRWGRRVSHMIGLAIIFALVGVWGALALSYWTNVPVSFFIAMIESMIYFASTAAR